jgi:hypothetical protein
MIFGSTAQGYVRLVIACRYQPVVVQINALCAETIVYTEPLLKVRKLDEICALTSRV